MPSAWYWTGTKEGWEGRRNSGRGKSTHKYDFGVTQIVLVLANDLSSSESKGCVSLFSDERLSVQVLDSHPRALS